ncbi:hypothetical protein HYS84_01730 [Candidatus Saccharibacteria bacterium]|nr:hypothetical protein [Candidatus Saccharibacteria bacterium]
MPPFREERRVDRGLPGKALRALEESGHGRRMAIVDTSYPIPRWAETVDYRGRSSADALLGVVRLIPVEGKVEFMSPDPNDSREGAKEALEAFNQVFVKLESEIPELQDRVGERHRLDHDELDGIGFYSITNDSEVDTLYLRTGDRRLYACATFLIGHSQVPEIISENSEAVDEPRYAVFGDMQRFVHTNPEYSVYALGHLWARIMSETKVGDEEVPLEEQGKITIGDEVLETIRIDEDYNPESRWRPIMLEQTAELSMNLETLEKMLKTGRLRDIKFLGPKAEVIVRDFLATQE